MKKYLSIIFLFILGSTISAQTWDMNLAPTGDFIFYQIKAPGDTMTKFIVKKDSYFTLRKSTTSTGVRKYLSVKVNTEITYTMDGTTNKINGLTNVDQAWDYLLSIGVSSGGSGGGGAGDASAALQTAGNTQIANLNTKAIADKTVQDSIAARALRIANKQSSSLLQSVQDSIAARALRIANKQSSSLLQSVQDSIAARALRIADKESTSLLQSVQDSIAERILRIANKTDSPTFGNAVSTTDTYATDGNVVTGANALKILVENKGSTSANLIYNTAIFPLAIGQNREFEAYFDKTSNKYSPISNITINAAGTSILVTKIIKQ